MVNNESLGETGYMLVTYQSALAFFGNITMKEIKVTFEAHLEEAKKRRSERTRRAIEEMEENIGIQVLQPAFQPGEISDSMRIKFTHIEIPIENKEENLPKDEKTSCEPLPEAPASDEKESEILQVKQEAEAPPSHEEVPTKEKEHTSPETKEELEEKANLQDEKLVQVKSEEKETEKGAEEIQDTSTFSDSEVSIQFKLEEIPAEKEFIFSEPKTDFFPTQDPPKELIDDNVPKEEQLESINEQSGNAEYTPALPKSNNGLLPFGNDNGDLLDLTLSLLEPK